MHIVSIEVKFVCRGEDIMFYIQTANIYISILTLLISLLLQLLL